MLQKNVSQKLLNISEEVSDEKDNNFQFQQNKFSRSPSEQSIHVPLADSQLQDMKCNKKFMFVNCVTVIFFIALYIQLIIKPLYPNDKYANLIPNFPYVIKHTSSQYRVYPSNHGYAVYACDDVNNNNNFNIKNKIQIGFHSHYQTFIFKTTGYMNFNISITDNVDQSIDKFDTVTILQDGQKTHQTYFTCTNDVCEFQIKSLLKENIIMINIVTSNFSVQNCVLLNKTLRQYAFNPERDYCSLYHITNPNKFLVFVPVEEVVQWGIYRNNYFEIYRYSKNQVLPNLLIILMLASIIVLINYSFYIYSDSIKPTQQKQSIKKIN